MCMREETPIQLERVEAFKIFSYCYDNKLRGAFRNSFVYELHYTVGNLIEIDDPEKVFYAFKTLEEAKNILDESIKWSFANYTKCIKKVTMYNVVVQGYMGCSEKSYQGYGSKKIFLHQGYELWKYM